MKRGFLLAAMIGGFAAHAQQPYFQQRVDTKLEVRLDDERHFLHGYEEFVYTNNSHDTLRYIYLHLWPNAYLHDHTPFAEQQVASRNATFYYSKPAQRGYIDSLDVHIDGKNVSLFSTDAAPDIARIDLPEALAPGAAFKLSTPFRVKIPIVFSRLGHSRQAYYISQWFPKPAVYDAKGWHPISYLDQGEFYSEIGSYDVRITLPQNYIVMATGNCTDAVETAWLDSLSKASLPSFTYPAKRSKHWRDSINRFPPSSPLTKTLHFEENNVHDFAFFADKRFIVRKDSFSVAGNANSITAFAAFLPASKNIWIKGTDYIKETVQRLSTEVGPYPYKTVKAVEGDLRAGGGMEYPTVTVIDNSIKSAASLTTVIVHEVGHNWFQGILASNERDYPWMDEGINSFYERKITRQIAIPDTTLRKRGDLTLNLEDAVYYQGIAAGTDQPFSLPATSYTTYNYGSDVYQKTAIHLAWLEGYVGQDNFRAGMQDYYQEWKHKHPHPEDLEASLKRHTNKPLDWFFRDALQNERRIDFSLKKVRNNAGKTIATVKNRSPFAAPVRIDAYRNHQLIDSIWILPFAGIANISLSSDRADTWIIGAGSADAKLSNNRYTKSGLFHGRGFNLGIGIGLAPTKKERIYLLPALGYNVYDGLLAGLLLHNLSLPEKSFRFAVAPMYGFSTRQFGGTGTAGYFIHPTGNAIQEIIAGAEVKSFHYDKTDHNTDHALYARYLKAAPYLLLTLKNHTPTSPVTNQLLLKGYYIREQYFNFMFDPTDSLYKPGTESQQKSYGSLRFSHQNNRFFNPFSYKAEAQLGADFAKLSVEGNLRIDYNKKNKSLYIRAFGGKFITINNNPFAAERYWLNAVSTGANDYLYDETFIARNEREGIFHQKETPQNGAGFRGFHQVSMREGGLKIPTDYYAAPLGRSDDWLASLNLKTDLPLGKIPLRLYFDVSTFSNAAKQNPSGDRFLYSGGIELYMLYEVIQINIPLIFSKDYNDYLKSIYPTGRLLNTVSFTINLQNINWLKTISGGIKLSGG